MSDNEFSTEQSTSRERQRRRQLDLYYEQVKLIILARQDPITGLLPSNALGPFYGNYIHTPVRENVYSILAAWGLALAYRHDGYDREKRHVLEQSVIRLMRGLLVTLMRQTTKAECLKSTHHPLQALHGTNHWLTGHLPSGDEFNHLQLDATALFLLILAQMTASGLRIIDTLDEVDFVQNLVHYLGQAYHTPDYGVWDQGDKPGEAPEIHASSIGMVKAALEALQGFDLFGAHGSPASVIHVVSDDIAHIRDILKTLLPRESNSKDTDAALLAIIGFPAFAVEDAHLVERTRHKIIGKLQGRYGFKRYSHDDNLTTPEPKSAHHESLNQLEQKEAEWPLFFTYLLLDRMLCGDFDQARQYRKRLESLVVERQGQRWLPELYYISENRLELEKSHPYTQERLPNQTIPLVWAQSLYLLGILLQEKFIQAHELDPLGRYSRLGRYQENCIQVALIAENEALREQLQQQGIHTQTAEQVAPIGIYPASALESILSKLGHNRTLGLAGRLPGWLGSLTTGQVFILAGGKTAVFTPSFLEPGGFYLGLDNHLLDERIKTELSYLSRHWDQPGQPLMVLSITHAMVATADCDALLKLLRELQTNQCPGVQIRTARLTELLPLAGWKRMDVYDFPIPMPSFMDQDKAVMILDWESCDPRLLTASEAITWRWEPDDRQLLQRLMASRNPYEQTELLILLWERLGPDFRIEERRCNLRQWLEAVYIQAGKARLWSIVRRAAGRLELVDVALQDAVTDIVTRQHSISVGRAYSHQAVISRPMSNAEIIERIRAYSGDDFRSQVLVQEIVLLLGMLIKATPDLFNGPVTLRPWRLLLTLTASLAREQKITQWEAMDTLLEYSPHELSTRLQWIIRHADIAQQSLAQWESLSYRGEVDDLQRIGFPLEQDEPTLVGRDVWSTWREINGVLTRLPVDFHCRVWEILRHCRGLVIGDRLNIQNRLDGPQARQVNVAQVEQDLAPQVERLLNNIQAPEYRQLSIETLLTLANVFRVNPELYIEDDLVLDVLIGTAVYHAWREQQGSVLMGAYNEYCTEAWSAFYAYSPYRVSNAIMVALDSLLVSADRKVKEEVAA